MEDAWNRFFSNFCVFRRRHVSFRRVGVPRVRLGGSAWLKRVTVASSVFLFRGKREDNASSVEALQTKGKRWSKERRTACVRRIRLGEEAERGEKRCGGCGGLSKGCGEGEHERPADLG